MKIPVNATAAGAQTDYQMRIILHSKTGENEAGEIYLNDNLEDTTDFNDIRFTAADGIALKNYWTEKVEDETGGRVATVYVKLDTPLANSADYYLYYGKTDDVSASNYDNVFTKDYGETGLVGLWHMDEQSPGSELLTDWGFETWASETELIGWTATSTLAGARDVLRESNQKYGGLYSIKFMATENDGNTDFGVFQDITTVNNENYQINFYYHYSSLTQGTLKVEAYDNTNSISLGSESVSTASSCFSFISFRFTSTSTTDVRIYIYLNDETTGIVYVDNLSVKQSSVVLEDFSGNSNTGAIYGASRTDTDGGQWDSRSDIKFSDGSALKFDKINDYARIEDSDSLDLTNTGTIAMWTNINSYTSGLYPSLLLKGTSGGWSAGKYQIWQYSSSSIYGSIRDNSGSNYVSFGKPSTGEWHHLVFTWDGVNLYSYLDGENINSSSQTRNATTDSSPVYIGRSGTRYFDGQIDEVRIYNRALSAEEISRQYLRSKYASPSPEWATSGIQECYDLSVITQSVVAASQVSATLNGYLNGFGADSSIDVYFRWGLNADTLDQLTTSTILTDYGFFSKEISGLSINTTYYFQAVAENNSETAIGEILSFKTVALETDYYGVIINNDGSLTFTNKDTKDFILTNSPKISFSYLDYDAVTNGNNLNSVVNTDGDSITITTFDDSNPYVQLTHRYILSNSSPYINYTATLTYKQSVYVTAERFDFIVPSQNAEVMTRDLNLTSFNNSATYWSDLYTPKVVRFANGLSFLGSDTMESMQFQASSTNAILSFYSDYAENHPHHYKIKNGGGDRIDTNETQREINNTYSVLVNFAIDIDETINYLIKMRQPYGYNATLTLSNHPDNEILETFKAVAYGTENEADPSYGAKGIAARGVGWTKGIFIEGLPRDGIDYAGDALNDDNYKNLTDAVYQDGVEIIGHSITNNTDSREIVQSGLQTLMQYNAKNWIDHGAASGENNWEDLASQGAIKGDENYILDLLDQYNYQYAWSYKDLTTNNYAINMLKPSATGDIRPFLYYNNRVDDDTGDDKKIYLWSTVNTVKKPDLYYTSDNVDDFISERGIHIAHEYYGAPSIENHAWRNNNGTIEIYPDFDTELAYIAEKRAGGLLWSPTMVTFADYLVSLKDVLITYNSDGTITVANNSSSDVTGLTLLAEYDIQSVKFNDYDLITFGGDYGDKEIILPTITSGSSVILDITYGDKDSSLPTAVSNDTGKNKVNEIVGYWDAQNEILTLTMEFLNGIYSFTVTAPAFADKVISVKDVAQDAAIGKYNASDSGEITFSVPLGSAHTFKIGETPLAPTIGSTTVLSYSSIRYNFTDNADNEIGFKLYNDQGDVVSNIATANLSYIEETGLSGNTYYSGRYVTAYNSCGDSIPSSPASAVYTLADISTNFNRGGGGYINIITNANNISATSTQNLDNAINAPAPKNVTKETEIKITDTKTKVPKDKPLSSIEKNDSLVAAIDDINDKSEINKTNKENTSDKIEPSPAKSSGLRKLFFSIASFLTRCLKAILARIKLIF